MAAVVTQTSTYVEGGFRTRRYRIVGDTSYPTGGYDVFALIAGLMGTAAVPTINRIVSINSNTVASQALGTPVAIRTYNTNAGASGILSALSVALVNGATQVANATNVSTMDVELIVEGN